jgi:enoyl-CoA hydratase
VVARGGSRAAAEALARGLAALPQAAMRTDRRSVYDNALTDDTADALRREGAGGYAAVFAEGLVGAARFAAGAGRHGAAQ